MPPRSVRSGPTFRPSALPAEAATGFGEGPAIEEAVEMAAKALPVEKQVLKVIRDGLRQEAAARCGITTNQS
jgi:hypothetical protein